MLGVTTIGRCHVGSQALGEVGHQLVDVFLWKLEGVDWTRWKGLTENAGRENDES